MTKKKTERKELKKNVKHWLHLKNENIVIEDNKIQKIKENDNEKKNKENKEKEDNK